MLLHDAVAEAVVCGIPDKHRGEIVKAYVVLKPGTELEPSELRQFLRDKLAPFEQLPPASLPAVVDAPTEADMSITPAASRIT